jgi:hypothetical protein
MYIKQQRESFHAIRPKTVGRQATYGNVLKKKSKLKKKNWNNCNAIDVQYEIECIKLVWKCSYTKRQNFAKKQYKMI